MITKDSIKRIEQDIAGKWRIWVEVSPDECVILKFDHKPTLTEAKEEIKKVLLALETRENGTA